MDSFNAPERCPECGSSDLIRDYEAGELVCEQCGYVVSSNMVSVGPEWRAFDEKQRGERERTGVPLTWTVHDRGLSTIIDWRGRDAQGRLLKPEDMAQVNRIRKWHRRSKVSDSTSRNLTYALTEITKIAHKLNLPRNVQETASVLYRRAINKGLIKGRKIESVAAASVYMACRQCNVVRSLERVASAADISVKEQSRAYRQMLRKLDADVPRFSPHDHLSSLVNRLSISGDAELIAKDILDRAAESGLTHGRAASSITAAAMYIAGQLTDAQFTQGDVAKAAQVTEVTIRNRYKEIMQEFNILVKL